MEETMENNEKVFMLSSSLLLFYTNFIYYCRLFLAPFLSLSLSLSLSVCVCVCVCVCVYIYIIYLHIYTRARTHTLTHIHTYTRHIDLPCLIKMKYKTLVHIEHFRVRYFGNLSNASYTLLFPHD